MALLVTVVPFWWALEESNLMATIPILKHLYFLSFL